jgi:hypothetical protein
MTMNATTMPPSMTSICCFCVWLTARAPPITVYAITTPPMHRQVSRSDQPSTDDKMMAGA